MASPMTPHTIQEPLPFLGLPPLRPRGETQAEFGRRIGLSQQRVAQLKKDGLPTLPNGKIDVERALVWVDVNLDLERRARGKATSGSPTDAAAGAGSERAAGASLVEARRRHEILKAERTKQRLQIDAGELIQRSEAAAVAFEFNRWVRDAWLGWSGRVAPLLASEAGVEVVAIFGPLERAVREHLAELAELPVPELLRHGT
jgi:hypothetical protein